LKIGSPIIITSPGNRKRLALDSIFSSNIIYSNVECNPTFDDCSRVIQYCKNKSFDGVIALGGGSPMDLAKFVMAHLSTSIDDVIKLLAYKGNYLRNIQSIFIPTTHGTGSEVTMWGTIWDMNDKKKYSISHYKLYPDVAILDGKLTLSLPLDISIITILDALSHSFESIWNINTNPISTSFAIDAITLILKNIDGFKKNPNNLKIRDRLMLASNKAGLAFSNTETAAAHSISYPLTLQYGIPHGIASSLTLIPLLHMNKKQIKKELNILMNKLELSRFSELEYKIKKIPQGIVKYSLSKWGVKKYEVDLIIPACFTKSRMGNNIVRLSSLQVRSILMDIF
jgi:phosphonate metabolism-associated iron-containing alcohol dehydrogenase